MIHSGRMRSCDGDQIRPCQGGRMSSSDWSDELM